MTKQFSGQVHNKQMADRLGAVKSQIKTRKTFAPTMPSVLTWKEDGVDHINISMAGKTQLGKALDMMAPIGFTHPKFGHFRSVAGFWYWLTREGHDDQFRTRLGPSLKKYGDSFKYIRVPNFRAMVIEATWLKLQQNPHVMRNLYDSELPFDCYYHYGRENGVPIRHNFTNWLVEGFNCIRTALHSQTEPDFSVFQDDPAGTDIYKKFMIMVTGRDDFEFPEPVEVKPKTKRHQTNKADTVIEEDNGEVPSSSDNGDTASTDAVVDDENDTGSDENHIVDHGDISEVTADDEAPNTEVAASNVVG